MTVAAMTLTSVSLVGRPLALASLFLRPGAAGLVQLDGAIGTSGVLRWRFWASNGESFEPGVRGPRLGGRLDGRLPGDGR